MTEQLRLLFLNYEYPPIGGGGGTTTHFLAENISAQGHHVYVLTGGIPGHYGKERLSDNLSVERIATTRSRPDASTVPQMGLYVAHASLLLPARIRDFKPDVIHVFFSFPTGAVMGWARYFYPQPYVISLLGGDVPGADPAVDTLHKVLMPFTRALWKGAGAVVPNSQRLGELAANVVDMRYPVIPNGVDLRIFHPRRSERAAQQLRYLFVGRLVEQKGLDILLNALAQVKNQLPEWRLTVIGDGPKGPEYRRLAESAGIEELIQWKGWVDFSELPAIYREHDIFILPSRYEGMPSVVIQAMACGCAVLATQVYGIDELVNQGINGYHVPLNSPGAFEEGLVQISNHPNLADMQQAAVEQAAHFGWDRIAQEYVDLYRQILKKDNHG